MPFIILVQWIRHHTVLSVAGALLIIFPPACKTSSVRHCKQQQRLCWLILMEFLLQQKAQIPVALCSKTCWWSCDTFPLIRRSADICGAFVRAQFTFQQCSVCHEALGAIDTAAAFTVVRQSVEFCLWLQSVDAGSPSSAQRDANQVLKSLKLHFRSSWHC